MAVATFEDVAVAIGRPITSGEEIDQVEHWLTGAELQIVARLGDVAELDQVAVVYVEAEAVAAKLANPNGYQYEAIDDYRYGLPTESRRVTITDEWWDLLTPADGSGSAFTITPYGVPGYSVEPDWWVTPTEQAP
jgi:hypothetical protein